MILHILKPFIKIKKILGIVVLSLNDWRNLKISKIEKGSQYNLFHHHHRK